MTAGSTGLMAALRAALARSFRLSPFALAIGLLFFAASLTPSLIPRSPPVQGILGGMLVAIGYMLGRLAESLWRYMEIAPRDTRAARLLSWLLLALAVAAAIVGLLKDEDRRNSLARNARSKASDDESWESAAGKLVTLYGSLRNGH